METSKSEYEVVKEGMNWFLHEYVQKNFIKIIKISSVLIIILGIVLFIMSRTDAEYQNCMMNETMHYLRGGSFSKTNYCVQLCKERWHCLFMSDNRDWAD